MAELTVFYSRAGENYFAGEYRYINVGNTEKAAKMIAEATGSDIFKIEQKTSYSADYLYCVDQARNDLRKKARPELVTLPKNLNKYDEIYLGYPIYCRYMPMAVYTFLESFDWNGKTIHPFCTHEGSGISSTEKEILRVCKGAKVTEGLEIFGSYVDTSKPIIEKWLCRKPKYLGNR
ncbi:MAG: flavodoxin [Clostridiales bacterium]|nr:flavodoxin [Clostridiales bacterium]